MINLSNICKSFQDNGKFIQLYDGLNIRIPEGEFLTILGPNGCGKSTLFNLITGIDKDFTGNILINGSKKGPNNSVAYMLQKDLLLPWLTVLQNILLGVEIQKKNKLHAIKIAEEYLEQLKIPQIKNEYPSNLSGGERQKVSLIRTLLLDTDILLLDEPFSAIDYNTRLELQTMIFKYAEKKNTTVVLVSHDIDEAIAVSDRIIILGQKPQGVVYDIKINLDLSDRNPITARQDSNFANYYSMIWENYPR